MGKTKGNNRKTTRKVRATTGQSDTARAALLMHDAALALHFKDESAATPSLGLLAALPHPAVDRELRRMLNRLIDAAWTKGWQPADLLYQLRRGFGDRAAGLMTDAIAAQMREYAAATVDPQWTRQLSALDAEVWWTDDDTWLATLAARANLSRVELLTHAAEVVSTLAVLPPLQHLGPPPGTTRHAGVEVAEPTAVSEGHERILRKVRALLAKAESTEFPEEAETLSAQAQQLIAKYSIDAALLAADSAAAGADPTGRRIGLGNPYESAKLSLLNVVADANRCRAIWHKQLGMASVLGFPADLDAVELMFMSLLVQATAAMSRAGSRHDANGVSRTRSFRQSFLAAYAQRIGERLRGATHDATTAAQATTRTDLLPVLAARTEAVDKAVDTLFTGLTRTRTSVTNPEGWYAGRAAADVASLRHRSPITG